MSRLIDADKFLKHEIKRCDGEMPYIGTCSTNNFTLKSEVDKFSTVDAVPVVRCKNCIHRYTEDCPMRYEWSEWHDGRGEYIDYYNDNTEDNYFCCKGERNETD